jgi:hypothetical protein
MTDVMDGYACTLRVNSYLSDEITDTSFPTLPWVRIPPCTECELTITGPPILACVHKGVPGIFMDCHMMVAEPEKVRSFLSSTPPIDKGR